MVVPAVMVAVAAVAAVVRPMGSLPGTFPAVQITVGRVMVTSYPAELADPLEPVACLSETREAMGPAVMYRVAHTGNSQPWK